MSRRAPVRATPRRAHAPAASPHEKRSPKGRSRAAASPIGGEPPEIGGDKRAALLMGCYRAAAEHSDSSLALLALKLRQFSGRFAGGKVSFSIEGACLVGVCGRLADLAQQVTAKVIEQSRGDGPLPEGDPSTPLRLNVLMRDALLAVQELEALRLAYDKKKATVDPELKGWARRPRENQQPPAHVRRTAPRPSHRPTAYAPHWAVGSASVGSDKPKAEIELSVASSSSVSSPATRTRSFASPPAGPTRRRGVRPAPPEGQSNCEGRHG
jgi:hypothetical protein